MEFTSIHSSPSFKEAQEALLYALNRDIWYNHENSMWSYLLNKDVSYDVYQVDNRDIYFYFYTPAYNNGSEDKNNYYGLRLRMIGSEIQKTPNLFGTIGMKEFKGEISGRKIGSGILKLKPSTMPIYPLIGDSRRKILNKDKLALIKEINENNSFYYKAKQVAIPLTKGTYNVYFKNYLLSDYATDVFIELPNRKIFYGYINIYPSVERSFDVDALVEKTDFQNYEYSQVKKENFYTFRFVKK